jgi:hypothetical protein
MTGSTREAVRAATVLDVYVYQRACPRKGEPTSPHHWQHQYTNKIRLATKNLHLMSLEMH